MGIENQIFKLGKRSGNLLPFSSTKLLIETEGLRSDGEVVEKDQITSDTIMKKEFLYLIGLLDRETAEYVIQKSRRIKLRHKLQTEYLTKKMLKMQPRFYLENGKVKRLQRTPQKTKKTKQDDRKKKIHRKCNESRGVYFTIPKNQNSKRSTCGSRYHLSRKVATAQGLSERSKKLLQACNDVSVRVLRMKCQAPSCHSLLQKAEAGDGLSKRTKKLIQLCKDLSVRVVRMSDQEIAEWKTKNPRKEVRAEMHRPSSSVQIQNEQFTARPSKRRHRYLKATVDLYNMTEEDIQTAQNLQKKSKLNKPI